MVFQLVKCDKLLIHIKLYKIFVAFHSQENRQLHKFMEVSRNSYKTFKREYLLAFNMQILRDIKLVEYATIMLKANMATETNMQHNANLHKYL